MCKTGRKVIIDDKHLDYRHEIMMMITMTNNGHDHDNDGCQTKVEKLDLQRTEYALFPSLIHQVTTINKTFASFNQYLS